MISLSSSIVAEILLPTNHTTRVCPESSLPVMHIAEHRSSCGRFARGATLRIASMAGCAAPGARCLPKGSELKGRRLSIHEDKVRRQGGLLVVERSLLGEDRPVRLVEAHLRPE